MYSPHYFTIKDKTIIEDFIQQYPFSILVSNNNDTFDITHIPINRLSDKVIWTFCYTK